METDSSLKREKWKFAGSLPARDANPHRACIRFKTAKSNMQSYLQFILLSQEGSKGLLTFRLWLKDNVKSNTTCIRSVTVKLTQLKSLDLWCCKNILCVLKFCIMHVRLQHLGSQMFVEAEKLILKLKNVYTNIFPWPCSGEFFPPHHSSCCSYLLIFSFTSSWNWISHQVCFWLSVILPVNTIAQKPEST